VDLEELGHAGRVLAGLPRPFLELAPQHADLLVRGADRDHPVGEPAGLAGVERPGRRDVDLDRVFRARVELRALEREVLAAVLRHLAGEELVDDLDGLEHHRRARSDLRPLAADDVLVERLAGAEPQPEPTGEHRPERRRGVGDHGRVVAEAGTGDSRSEAQRRPQPQRPHERPGERRLALLRGPGVEVLRDHEAGAEPRLLGLRTPVEQVGRVELLEHGRVADRRHEVLQPVGAKP
jgi:hypothetical protein